MEKHVKTMALMFLIGIHAPPSNATCKDIAMAAHSVNRHGVHGLEPELASQIGLSAGQSRSTQLAMLRAAFVLSLRRAVADAGIYHEFGELFSTDYVHAHESAERAIMVFDFQKRNFIVPDGGIQLHVYADAGRQIRFTQAPLSYKGGETIRFHILDATEVGALVVHLVRGRGDEDQRAFVGWVDIDLQDAVD